MIIEVLIEGLILGILLIGICAVGIRNGAVGMVHLYQLLVWLLADVYHIIGDECNGSFSCRWLVGRSYECMDDSGN